MRPASSPGLGEVCEEGRDLGGGGWWGAILLEDVFLLAKNFFFLHRLYIFHLQVIKGILRETVSVPPLNRINVTAVNKDLCQLVLTGCWGI